MIKSLKRHCVRFLQELPVGAYINQVVTAESLGSQVAKDNAGSMKSSIQNGAKALPSSPLRLKLLEQMALLEATARDLGQTIADYVAEIEKYPDDPI